MIIFAIFITLVPIFIIIYIKTRRKFIKNIPIIPSNSIFGYTKLLIDHNGDNHLTYLATANAFGPVVQYSLFGESRFCVYDKRLASTILESVEVKDSALKVDTRYHDVRYFCYYPNIIYKSSCSFRAKRGACVGAYAH